MIDSTNPRQLADNIRKLWDKFKSISGDLLPSRSTATTGQILKLTGENKTPNWSDEYSYTPPAFSETEVNTGQKWIDGKEIYRKVFTGTYPENTSNVLEFDFSNNNKLLFANFNFTSSGSQFVNYSAYVQQLSNKITVRATSTTITNQTVNLIVYYTKPDPVPATRDDDTPEEPEVKETKTTRKKTK